jgi:hypothetical protein
MAARSGALFDRASACVSRAVAVNFSGTILGYSSGEHLPAVTSRVRRAIVIKTRTSATSASTVIKLACAPSFSHWPTLVSRRTAMCSFGAQSS